MKFCSCPPLPGVSVGLALPWTPPRPAGPRPPHPFLLPTQHPSGHSCPGEENSGDFCRNLRWGSPHILSESKHQQSMTHPGLSGLTPYANPRPMFL